MGFRTKLDYSSNRQISQREKTNTILSGSTIFGLPFSGLTVGPDLITSGVTDSYGNVISTFSGNSSATIYNWFDSRMQLAAVYLSAITPTTSAITQETGYIYTGNTSITVDDNPLFLNYTGTYFTLSVNYIVDLGGGSYSGTVEHDEIAFLSASSLDYSGRTIWIDNPEITRTNRLIISDTPVSGYVWTCINSEGMGEWQYNGSSSGTTIWTAGTGVSSAVLGGSGGIASGQYSVTEGQNTIAGGANSHAEGYNTTASGNNSHAEGSFTKTNGMGSHAEGYNTTAYGIGSHAEGNSTIASGTSSHAEGMNTTASGNYSHAEGSSTTAYGDYSHAEGGTTIANGNQSHAEGSNTIASGNTAHAEGYQTQANGYASHAEGGNTVAGGDYSHAEGTYTIAGGYGSHAEGGNTIASNDYTHAEGYQTLASGQYSHAQGQLTQASGQSSHAEGSLTIASGTNSHAEGDQTIASGYQSHAEGFTTIASGNTSHAEGRQTIAGGNYSHAEGLYTQALDDASHAEGYHTTASGGNSHAEGNYSIASNTAAHAEGQSTLAIGPYSHAEGGYTTASGDASHAEGSGTIASGNTSHAEGTYTIAGGDYSHAGGYYSQAIGNYSFVHGQSSKATNTNTVVFGLNITGTSSNTVYVNNLVIDGLNSTDPIATNASGLIVAGTSDARLKQNINELNNALDVIKSIRGVSFEYTPESEMGSGVRYGFIAQEVQEFIPDIVRARAKGDGMLSLNYNEIVPILVEAVKELSIDITNNTYLETQTILAEDNNIELNYNGTHQSALDGGITIKHGIDTDTDTHFKLNSDGDFITNVNLIPKGIVIPEYTPTSSSDTYGIVGNFTRDENYLYIKTNNSWKRANLENF